MNQKTSQLRDLLPEEVQFTISTQPENLEVRGNAMASDDEEFDRQVEG